MLYESYNYVGEKELFVGRKKMIIKLCSMKAIIMYVGEKDYLIILLAGESNYRRERVKSLEQPSRTVTSAIIMNLLHWDTDWH